MKPRLRVIAGGKSKPRPPKGKETEAQCKARGGRPLKDAQGRYVGCYPPRTPADDAADAIERARRKAIGQLFSLALWGTAGWLLYRELR